MINHAMIEIVKVMKRNCSDRLTQRIGANN